MNFEYKVGYLWKSHETDPSLQSWNWEISTKSLGRNVESARADWSTFAYRQFSVNPARWRSFFCFLSTFSAVSGSGQPCSFFFFSFLSLSNLSLLFPFLSSLEIERGCPLVVWGVSKPRTEEVIIGEMFRRAETAAYKFQNSDSEDSAQI